MDDDRSRAALRRIDHALGRVEAALQAAPPADPELAERHERLRAAAAAAVAELDALIAEREG